ncbi:MAG: glutamyl-tRNA reductase [Porphyromonas sp.]|nr:glutamyl-tRNA reductase [Porphyromonas sp.]
MSSRQPNNSTQTILATLGVDHQSAPISIREVLSFSPAETSDLLTKAKAERIIKGGVLISTCNRTQIVVESNLREEELERHLVRFVLEYKQLPATLRRYFRFFKEHEAVSDLFLLAAGYRSMVQGETQILGQIKSALQIARSSGNSTKVLTRLFEKSLEISKKIRSSQEVWAVNRSAGAAAVELLHSHFGEASLREGRHLIIGAGQMASTLVQALRGYRVEQMMLFNRTPDRAERFGESHGISEVYHSDQLAEVLRKAQWVWVATSASSPIITREMLEEIGAETELRIFDLGLPRNVAPEVGQLPTVSLFCIDDLDKCSVLETQVPPEAEGVVRAGAEEFAVWREGLQMRDVFSLIWSETEEMAQTELEKSLAQLDSTTHKAVEQYSQRIVKAYASTLIARLRRISDETRDPIYADVMRDIFTQE